MGERGHAFTNNIRRVQQQDAQIGARESYDGCCPGKPRQIAQHNSTCANDLTHLRNVELPATMPTYAT